MLFSRSAAHLFLDYMTAIYLEGFSVPDDVFLGILAGQPERDLSTFCQIHRGTEDVDARAVFHRCKNICKERHPQIARECLGAPIR